MEVTMKKSDVIYVGTEDRVIDLFEGMYRVPDGVTYNSYVIADEKIAVMDTVDAAFGDEWLKNIADAIGGKEPDYLVISHMEPDHSANIMTFADRYKNTVLVGNAQTFGMAKRYFGDRFDALCGARIKTVKDGDVLELGAHSLKFVFTPMVHWPEVMMSYDAADKCLYSADGFGRFGATLDAPWDDEARRYYIGIVGKYGMQVQAALKKLGGADIRIIRPLHGPVLNDDLGHYLGLYDKWSSYTPEAHGAVIAYTSVYGHTKAAAELLKAELDKLGAESVIFDLARDDMSECVAQSFKYDTTVFATTTYNTDIFPPMRELLDALAERNFQNRRVAFIENGTWAPAAARVMKAKLEPCKNLTELGTVKIMAALTPDNAREIRELAERIKN